MVCVLKLHKVCGLYENQKDERMSLSPAFYGGSSCCLKDFLDDSEVLTHHHLWMIKAGVQPEYSPPWKQLRSAVREQSVGMMNSQLMVRYDTTLGSQLDKLTVFNTVS